MTLSAILQSIIDARYHTRRIQDTGSWEARYAAEFFGTLILVLLGNGAVANAFLKNTTGNDDPGLANGGWLLVASGYGLGVMLPAMMFGSTSGNHLNPAITIGQATVGLFPC